jgi:hypothetical protein
VQTTMKYLHDPSKASNARLLSAAFEPDQEEAGPPAGLAGNTT